MALVCSMNSCLHVSASTKVHVCVYYCDSFQFVCSLRDLWWFIISGLQGYFQMPAFSSHPEGLLSASVIILQLFSAVILLSL